MPEIYSVMLEAVNNGDKETAYAMQRLSDAYGNLYQQGKTLGESLWALKVLMKEKKLCEPIVMPPLRGMDKSEEDKLITGLKKLLSES